MPNIWLGVVDPRGVIGLNLLDPVQPPGWQPGPAEQPGPEPGGGLACRIMLAGLLLSAELVSLPPGALFALRGIGLGTGPRRCVLSCGSPAFCGAGLWVCWCAG